MKRPQGLWEDDLALGEWFHREVAPDYGLETAAPDVRRARLPHFKPDDPLAFVLAHEMAHHELGHLNLFHGRLSLLRTVPGAPVAALAVYLVEKLLISPEWELAADARALELCLAAGY